VGFTREFNLVIGTESAIQFIIYEQMKARLLTRQNRIRAEKGFGRNNELTRVGAIWFGSVSQGDCSDCNVSA
jgi:hypothetical protein